MKFKITVPENWQELTDYQQREIINIINEIDNDDFSDSFLRIVQVSLMKKNNIFHYFRMRWTLRNFPISTFRELLSFLLEKPTLYTFPKIKGLKEPAPRLGDITMKQFSICDTLFYRLQEARAKNQETESERFLRQLVAALYRIDDFDTQKLPKIAKITDKIDHKEAVRIAFVFSAIRMYISDSYPSIFPKKKEEDDTKPVFRTKERHTPFSKIIVMMAADELRLLGNLHECQNTLVYDFFNAFIESKIIHKQKTISHKP